ncbi:MAG: translation initiation factor IF-2 [Lachnospiraceae bacterium]|nr:translation initiation factor IF-2 [Lachnospiraceae bacterium]
MAIEKNMNNANEGEVKKKKYSVVFRQQNSQQNSLKTRPQGSTPPRKPAGPRPASPARPAEAKTPVKKPEPSAAVKAEEKEKTVSAAEAVKKTKPAAPAEKPVKETAPIVEQKAEPEKKAEAPAEPKAEKPAEIRPEEKETVEKKTDKEPAAGEAVPENKAEETVKEAAPQESAAPQPEAPRPRFVDMSQVRAAEQEAKIRSQRIARQQNEKKQTATSGRPEGGRPRTAARPAAAPGQTRPGQAGSRPTQGFGPRPSQGSGAARPVQGRGPSPFAAKDKDEDTRTARRPAPGGRSGAGKPGAAADFGGLGLSKNGKGGGKQPQRSNAVKDNARYNKGDSDEMRRPGGKNAKSGGKAIKGPEKTVKPAAAEPAEPQIKTITIPASLTIQELANAMKLQASAIIKKLFLSGKIYTVNQEIDYETAADIALEFDVIAEQEEQVDIIEELLKDSIEDREEDMVPRPPVVCVMGHVDHGKTSLLDAIRKTNVTSGEAGGITQHIGAYMVEINGQKITFLDTPGHEAFTAMRMRGAQATDIAILVVAADDGVMPQTVEAINHAKAAGVEIVVAINKIDKPGANIDKVKKELTEYGLIGEEWGGSNIFVPVSAKRGDGIEDLLEMLLLVAEVHELKANPNRNARGLVIEAQLDNTRGPVATVLVQKGTLKVGDNVAAGSSYGKIRAMLDDKGSRVAKATPGMPVEILGLNSVPTAGEIFIATANEKEARSYAQTFIAEGRKKLLDETRSRLKLDDIFSQIQSGNMKELNLIVKADVQGSVEAVKTSLTKLSNEEVMVKVIHSGAGNINESDVTLAAASNAIIIGFNVRMDAQVKSIADEEKVDVRLYDVIYKAIEDVENAMLGILDPIYEEQVLGHAVVRQVFKASGIGSIAGSYVTDGKIVRGSKCRITRGKDVLFDGNLASLKRFKDDVKEVASGYECGLVFEKFNDFDVDDTIEVYTMVQVERRKLPGKK